jgi:DNA polymerase III epsilon subunit-like protein
MRTLIFDTETTGLIKNTQLPLDQQPQVIEFYGYVQDTEGDDEEMQFRCNPGKPLPDIITRITGMTDQDLMHLPPFRDFADELKKLIESCDRTVAHNHSYDFHMISMEFDRLETLIRWTENQVCTVEITEWVKGHRLSLKNLHINLFGEAFDDAHSAKGDVEALRRCFGEIEERGWV